MTDRAAIDLEDLACGEAAPVALAMLAFRLDNLGHLARAYGLPASECALESVERLLRDAVGAGGVSSRAPDGVLTAVIWSPEVLGRDMSDDSCAAFVQSFTEKVAGTCVRFEGAVLRVAVSGAWSLSRDVRNDPDLLVAGRELKSRLDTVRFCGLAPEAGADWARRYKADMAQSAWLMAAMMDGRLLPTWQAVRSAHDGDAVLYHECLLRVLEEGRQESAGAAISALERLGLVSLLDHHVVSVVIDELRRDPDACLGVNISAHSAVPGGWWPEVVRKLRDMPGVADRLVIEITETARFPSIGDATCLATQLRKLGVRIALDDFGVGHASLRVLIGLQPDIVKIDAFFLRRAAACEREWAALRHLIGFAASFAAEVVVEGVETSAESQLALRAGAVWQQGYHMGYPSVGRSWVRAGTQANVLTLFESPQSAWPARRRAVG